MNPELKRAIKEVLEAFETPDSPEALVGAMYQLKRIYNQLYAKTNNSLRKYENNRNANKRNQNKNNHH